LGSRSEQAFGDAKRAKHKSVSGRRFAPYPNEVLDGGQKMRRLTAKALPNLQINSMSSQRQTHFRGPSEAREDARKRQTFANTTSPGQALAKTMRTAASHHNKPRLFSKVADRW